MKYYFTYDYIVNLEDGYGNRLQGFSDSYKLGIWEDLQDIFEYMFEKEYNKPYNELGWYLEPNAKELYKEVEDLWLHNALDTFELYNHDYNFQTFIMNKHSKNISGCVERKVIDTIKTIYPYGDIILYNIVSDYFEIEGEVQA